MDTLNKILQKFNITYDEHTRMPIEIPNIGRNDLAGLFHELEYKIGAEVGVESGVYSEVICKANPDARLYAIDAWQSHREYRDHTRQEKFDRFYQESKERLRPYNCQLMKEFSMEAVKNFDDRSLDFVYIDANHKFVEAANDIHHWSKRVRVGGIVAGHDYTKYKDLEVEIHLPQVLQGFTDAYHIKPWFVIGRNVDTVMSWFWVQLLK